MPVPKKQLNPEQDEQALEIRKRPHKAESGDIPADLSFSAPVPAPADAAANAAAPKTYTIQPGDSLSKIAKEQLGDASRWKEIFEANKDVIKDPNLIRVGQEITLP